MIGGPGEDHDGSRQIDDTDLVTFASTPCAAAAIAGCILGRYVTAFAHNAIAGRRRRIEIAELQLMWSLTDDVTD